MAGLVPAIHVFERNNVVDVRCLGIGCDGREKQK
jgi:hypothetical protein